LIGKLFAQSDQLCALVRDDEVAQHILDITELHQPLLQFSMNGRDGGPIAIAFKAANSSLESGSTFGMR
jgi:hypothetical protein